jgi:hypothetical protein
MLTLTYSKYGNENLYNITMRCNDKNKEYIISYNFNSILYSTKEYTINFIEEGLKLFNKKNLNFKKTDINCFYSSYEEDKKNYTNYSSINNTQHDLILDNIAFQEFKNIIKKLH